MDAGELSSSENDLNKVFEMLSSTSWIAQQSESQTTSNSSADLLSLSSSPSNIGSAIAGVVGGGASKLQALQKWFKGDSPEAALAGGASPFKAQARYAEVWEMPLVSVRELGRAMEGQQEMPNMSWKRVVVRSPQ